MELSENLGQKYIRRYKLKILRIYLFVIWTIVGLVNIDDLVRKEDIDDRLIALISLLFMILPTLFYIF